MESEVCLYIVPTPIGNLGDMTFRAIEVLRSVDIVLAEDTRKTGLLFKHFDIKTPLHSHHAHNEHASVAHLIERLTRGEKMALVSDAGTPAISDPGFLLVREAVAAGVLVSCLPGPTAFVPALIASGFPTDRFVFEGFLPHKKGRISRILALAEEPRTMIFYESPHRIAKALEQFIEVFGEERRVCLSREISKLYEQHLRGTLREVLAMVETTPPKGEIVLIIEGKK